MQDPRKLADGSKQDHPLLASFLQKLQDEDEPSQRAYPASIHLVQTVADTLDTHHRQHGSLNRHVIQLCITAFFWLMRPAEYLGYSSRNDDRARSSRSEAFRLEDITFTIRGIATLATTASLNEMNISDITYATLTFTDQKNAVRGEHGILQ